MNKSLVSSTALLAALFASQAIANDTANNDRITVTATKRPQLIEEVAGSVSVLRANAIEKANDFNSADEIAQLLPSVQAAVANGTQVAFQIRGIGAVDHQALTPTAAGIYADGVFLATNVQTGAFLYDLARIEVLKGPQGTLYGRNTSSGAINLISARPGSDQDNYVSASYGRFDRTDIQAGFGDALSDTLSFRLAGRFLHQDPTLDNVETDPAQPLGPDTAAGVRDEFGVRGALLWAPNDETSWLARAHYEENNGINAAPRNSSLDVDDHQISVGPDGVQDTDNEFYGAALEGNTVLGLWDLASHSSFEGYNQQYGFEFDGTQAPFGDETLNANLAYDRDFSQLTQEFRLSRSFEGTNVQFGVMAAREDFEQDYLIWCGELDRATLLGTCRYVGAPGRAGPTPASPGTATTLITNIDQERITAAAFTHNDIQLTERLNFVFGARYTFERIHGSGSGEHIFDDGVRAFNNRDGAGLAVGENTIRENRVSGNAALRYALNDTTQIYAAFSNGFKSGGFNGEVANNATHFQDEGLFGAETVNAYELGLKATPSDNLRFSLAGFYQDYQDPQARIFVNFPLPDDTFITSNSLSNLDQADVFGAEFEASWQPTQNFSIDAAVSVLDTEINQTTDVSGNAAKFDGNPLPFASKVSATLFGQYDIDLNADTELSLRSNAKYRSSYYLDAEGLDSRKQTGFTTWDAEATVTFKSIDLAASLWARNLLDKDYAVSGFAFIGYNTFIGDPRTYGVRLRKGF